MEVDHCLEETDNIRTHLYTFGNGMDDTWMISLRGVAVGGIVLKHKSKMGQNRNAWVKHKYYKLSHSAASNYEPRVIPHSSVL